MSLLYGEIPASTDATHDPLLTSVLDEVFSSLVPLRQKVERERVIRGIGTCRNRTTERDIRRPYSYNDRTKLLKRT